MLRSLAIGSLLAVAAHAQAPLEVLATLQPRQTLIVRSRVDGTVTRVFAGVGDAVPSLGNLASIGAPELLGLLGEQVAALGAAEEQLNRLTAQQRAATARLKIAERQVLASETKAKAAKESLEAVLRDLERVKVMHGAGTVPQGDVADVEASVLMARVHLAATEVAAGDDRDRIAAEREEVTAAGLAVTVQRLTIDAIRGRRDHHQALVDLCAIKNLLPQARVQRVLVGKGDVVVAGETPLFELIDDSAAVVAFDVPWSAASGLQPGAVVNVSATKDGEGVPAKVTAIAPVAVQGMVRIAAELEKPPAVPFGVDVRVMIGGGGPAK